MCRRSRRPFVADLLPGDPAKTNLRVHAGTREWIGGPQGLAALQAAIRTDLPRSISIVANIAGWWPTATGPATIQRSSISNLPPLGNPGRAAPLVTKTLLFIGEGSPAMANNGARLPAGMPPRNFARMGRQWIQGAGQIDWRHAVENGSAGRDDRRANHAICIKVSSTSSWPWAIKGTAPEWIASVYRKDHA